MTERLDQYLYHGRKLVEGWFDDLDAEAFRAILSLQADRGVGGNLCEIGIHFGKSFIPLALSRRPSEIAVAIDLWSDQTCNTDHSGGGATKADFLANLRRHGASEDGVMALEANSLGPAAAQILGANRPFRFFSIDGGHHLKAVRADLASAAATLGARGVIVLDDFFQTFWPEVTQGALDFLARELDFAIFAITEKKAYIARREDGSLYRPALRCNKVLQLRCLIKNVEIAGAGVLAFRALNAWSTRRRSLKAFLVRSGILVERPSD